MAQFKLILMHLSSFGQLIFLVSHMLRYRLFWQLYCGVITAPGPYLGKELKYRCDCTCGELRVDTSSLQCRPCWPGVQHSSADGHSTKSSSLTLKMFLQWNGLLIRVRIRPIGFEGQKQESETATVFLNLDFSVKFFKKIMEDVCLWIWSIIFALFMYCK